MMDVLVMDALMIGTLLAGFGGGNGYGGNDFFRTCPGRTCRISGVCSSIPRKTLGAVSFRIRQMKDRRKKSDAADYGGACDLYGSGDSHGNVPVSHNHRPENICGSCI